MSTDNGLIAPTAHLLYESHTAFRYLIEIAGVTVGAFTECTLPTIEIEPKEVREGGLNTYVHLLPGPRKSAHLTLKNGVGKNKLMDWFVEVMQEHFNPKAITVTLLDARAQKPICTWHLNNAYPIKWTGPQLQADSNAIAIQTIEFACGPIEMTVGEEIID